MSTPFSHFFTKINQISPLESNFTEVLSAIALKPKTLYFYGKMPKNISKIQDSTLSFERLKCVAIVGSRHNTRYGAEVAYKLAYELAKHGVIIISGLAYGIDSIAHRACLDAGGRTIAVLGTPIDKIYPTTHLDLAVEILKKDGAILSEYPPEGHYAGAHLSGSLADCEITHTSRLSTDLFPLAPGESFSEKGARLMDHKAAFLYRNRLIAGLADVVVIAEAASHSGSLNTAMHALDQGKEVFAVPGNITAPYSQGCNRLILQGATPYTEPDDILRILFPADFAEKQRRLAKNRLFGDTPEETAVLRVLYEGTSSGEKIMQRTVLPPEVFNQTISMLEIKSRVRSLGANNWALA